MLTNRSSAATLPLSQRKLPALDGVRGLAVLAVMFTHTETSAFPPLLREAFGQGWIGVDLFFVLSGFLITGILVDTRECANYFLSFYARRFLRIFPLYYGFLAVATLVFPYVVAPGYMPVRAERWLYFAYLMNWTGLAPWHHHILNHFWSLAIEEQFYLVWPLVVLLLAPRRLLPAVVTLEIAELAGRSWWVYQHGPGVAVQFATITRMDGLLLGAACALIVRQFEIPQRATASLLWCAVLLMLGYVVGFHLSGVHRQAFKQSLGYTILALGFGGLVLYSVLTDGRPCWQQAALCCKPLVLFGKYSYGTYVLHVPIFYFVNRLAHHLPQGMNQSPWFDYVLALAKFALAFGVASLSYNLYEKRFLALKDRFAPVYGKAPAATASAAALAG
jgi:peptidoglycan/LPS O-acetylase OafA/YrhL